MLKIVIIEDEEISVRLMTSIIEESCSDTYICGVAKDIQSSISLISQSHPDLIFVDVHLGNDFIFEALDQIEYQKYKIVFTSAHSDYAMKAFKYEAVDYILKPYNPQDIVNVINRVRHILETSGVTHIREIMNQFYNEKEEKVSFSSHEGICVIKKEDIIHCHGDGPYCIVNSVDGMSTLVSKSLGEVETIISSRNFLRVHTSHLINVHHIKKYLKEDGGSLLMSNGSLVPVSRRKKQEVIDYLLLQ